jgi:hypothetical protein
MKKAKKKKKRNHVFEGIKKGLEEALAYANGTADMSRYKVHIPEDLDVKAIREATGLTQKTRRRSKTHWRLDIYRAKSVVFLTARDRATPSSFDKLRMKGLRHPRYLPLTLSLSKGEGCAALSARRWHCCGIPADRT